MTGGLGNDLYYVDNIRDRVIETSALATQFDRVASTVTYSLSANVEALYLQGNGSINGTGNSLNNTIVGNNGNNVLVGGLGNDTLLGGVGNDILVGGAGNDTLAGGGGYDRFSFASTAERVDTIQDFSAVNDAILVSAAGFRGGLTANTTLAASQFALGTGARDASDRFVYNQTTGALFFDSDGTGASAQVQIATLSSRPTLTNADIFISA